MGEDDPQVSGAKQRPTDPSNGQLRIADNPDESRYEALLDGRLVGVATYRLEPGRIIFLHTEIMPALEGRGVGSRLAAGALDSARNRALAVVPRCPFIRAYVRTHPAYADLVSHDVAPGDEAPGEDGGPVTTS